MSRLSLVMGIFLATSVTTIIMLLAIAQNVSNNTLLYRGTIIFFIFGFLGSFFGSVLEVILIPAVEELEAIKQKKDLDGDNKELQAELGDLLDDYKLNLNQNEIGTPTDEPKPEKAIDDSNSTVVS